MTSRLWVERIALTGFRNYAAATIAAGPSPVVLCGPNGAGKTNFLEAISLLSPGQGLRRANFADLARAGQPTNAPAAWAVAARLHTRQGAFEVGTGLTTTASDRAGRIVRIDGKPQTGSGALADLVEMVWVTPAMDGLFTGPASDRRRFLDRLILCFDATHGTRANRFEKAMMSRNRLLADGVRDHAQLEAFELQMAETGAAIAAARVEALTALQSVIAARHARDPASPFPWAAVAIDGTLESEIAVKPSIEVEDGYLATLRQARERDRAAGRTLDGPHRADLIVGHGPKDMPARLSSTGEQKSLLLGLVLAHAELLAQRYDGFAPILLLDEITAHLDENRRAALFAEILRLGSQAWMTGTDIGAFAALGDRAQRWRVEDGAIRPSD